MAEVLAKEFACCFGTPQIIHSKRGGNFESAVLCKLLGIKKSRTPLQSKFDGMVERFNRTIECRSL